MSHLSWTAQRRWELPWGQWNACWSRPCWQRPRSGTLSSTSWRSQARWGGTDSSLQRHTKKVLEEDKESCNVHTSKLYLGRPTLLEYNVDQRKHISRIIAWHPARPLFSLSVCCSQNPSLRETINFKLASYTLKMASFEDNLDCATRQACMVLSGNDCKDFQRICYVHLPSNWDVLRVIGKDLLWTEYTARYNCKSTSPLTMYPANSDSSALFKQLTTLIFYVVFSFIRGANEQLLLV